MVCLPLQLRCNVTRVRMLDKVMSLRNAYTSCVISIWGLLMRSRGQAQFRPTAPPCASLLNRDGRRTGRRRLSVNCSPVGGVVGSDSWWVRRQKGYEQVHQFLGGGPLCWRELAADLQQGHSERSGKQQSTESSGLVIADRHRDDF